MSDTRMFALMALMALWVLCFGGAFVAYQLTPPEGDGFLRGLNRVMVFLGWQGVAGMISIPIWVLGRVWPKRSAVRRMAAGPILLTVLEVLALIALFVLLQY